MCIHQFNRANSRLQPASTRGLCMLLVRVPIMFNSFFTQFDWNCCSGAFICHTVVVHCISWHPGTALSAHSLTWVIYFTVHCQCNLDFLGLLAQVSQQRLSETSYNTTTRATTVPRKQEFRRSVLGLEL